MIAALMTFARRFLVFQAFLLWQGGFVFYAGVVVPVGTEVLGDALRQGAVTQQVTNWLNLIGLIWHGLFAWDVFAGADPSRRRRRWRAGLWAVSLALLAGLAGLHPKLDAMFDGDTISRGDRATFYLWHETYLCLSTAHWVLGLANAGLTLAAWAASPRDSATSVLGRSPAV
ncbi:MAG: hypothetical protein ABGY75_23135 [Gemmataceae bacterium]